MSTGPGRAVELLVAEAWDLYAQGRYAQALRAAERAVAVARELDDLGAEVRAVTVEAAALRMLGDHGAALARHSRVLALAADPASAPRLAGNDEEVARAYTDWVESAQFLTGIAWPELERVLDEGEAWLRRSGHPEWRAGLLRQRAKVLDRLGRTAEAVPHAEEALGLELRHPGAPGYTLAAYRWSLGNFYRRAGRPGDAEPLYGAVLDDPASEPQGRKVAWEGLAWCALAAGQAAEAVACARSAVEEAESLGDDNLCPALSVLVEAARAADVLDLAAAAAGRHRDAATHLDNPLRLYFALRDCLDVALDRADREQAHRLVDQLTPLAEAMDQSASSTTYTAEVAARRRLAESEGE